MDVRRNGVIHVPHMVDGKVVKSEIKWSFGTQDDAYLLVFNGEKTFTISKDFSELEIFTTVFEFCKTEYCKNQPYKSKRPLKEFLRLDRYSQDAWAEWLGISKSAFNKKLNGKLKWKELEKREISDRLGVNVNNIDFEGEPKC